MAKVWKKLQRADSPFAGDVTGNVTGKVNNVAVSGVYTTSNKPTKGDVGLGSVTNHAAYHAGNKPTKSDVGLADVENITTSAMRSGVTKANVGLGNVEDKSAATIMSGAFTGNIGGTSAADIKTKAVAGEAAKSAVDGNAAVTMVGGSINIGSGEWTVDSSGNQVTKGTITINKDTGGEAGLTLESGSTGDMKILMEGANPAIDMGGEAPLGTTTHYLRRGTTGNQCRIFFTTGSTVIGGIGFANQPTANNTQLTFHYGSFYDNSSPYTVRDFTIDADHKIGFWQNDKTFAGLTIGSDGTNKGLYVKNGGVGVGHTTTTDGELKCNTLSIQAQSNTNFQGGYVTVGSLKTSNSGSTADGTVTNASNTGAGINWGSQNEFYLNAGAVRQVTIGTANVTFAKDIIAQEITLNSDSHGYVTNNSYSTGHASWVQHKQGGSARWLSGIEGGETDYQLYSTLSGNSGTRFRIAAATGNATFSGNVRLPDDYVIEWGGANARINGSNANDRLRFYTGDTPRLTIDSSGNSTFAGIATAPTFRATSKLVSADNMFMAGGQFYLGAEDSSTDDTWRMYGYSAGQFILESRESGTWTERFKIGTSGDSTFKGNVTTERVYQGNGTTALPSHTYENDTDTGMFRKASNQLGFSTGGTQALYFDTNQKANFQGDIGLQGTVQCGQLETDADAEIGGDCTIDGSLSVDSDIDWGDTSSECARPLTTGTQTIQGSKTFKVNVETDARKVYSAAYLAGSDNYQANYGWRGIQFGNNGQNTIVFGNTATGGYGEIWVNNTTDMDSDNHNSPNGTKAADFRANGTVTFPADGHKRGWHGSDTVIKILPSDFMQNDDNTTYNAAIVDNGGKLKVTHSNLEAYAMYSIPMGFAATTCICYGNDGNNTIYVYEGFIDNTTATAKGNARVNQTVNFTDVTASTTNYLIIKWSPTATSDYLYGGKITITRT